MGSKYAIVGFTPDPPGPCEECGTQIRKGVWVREVDPDGNLMGDAACVGSDCASRLIGYFDDPGKRRKKATRKAVEDRALAVQRRIEARWAELQQRMAKTLGEANALYQTSGAPVEGSVAYQLDDWLIRIHPERLPFDQYLVEQAGFVPYQRAADNPQQIPEEDYDPAASYEEGTVRTGREGSYGREYNQLAKVRLDALVLPELHYGGETGLHPAKRAHAEQYAEWMRQGHEPPPIDVLEMEDGRLRVMEGHRRVVAARMVGRDTISAWVHPAMPHPEGIDMKVSATLEHAPPKERWSNPPKTIQPGPEWARQTVAKLAHEALSFDEDDILAQWEHGPYVIRVVDAEQTLFWVAFFADQPVGAGTFDQLGQEWTERSQAVVPEHQRQGIYTSVLQWMRDYAEPFSVEGDGEQSPAMQAAWQKAGARDEGDYYVLDNPAEEDPGFEYQVEGEPDNVGSIDATLTDYEVVPGIRAIPMSEFNATFRANFYSNVDRRRVNLLKKEIEHSRTVTPLIAVKDAEGYYILEGAHRLVALGELGAKTLPALLVIDRDDSGERSNPRVQQIRGHYPKGGIDGKQSNKRVPREKVAKIMAEQDHASGRFRKPISQLRKEWDKRVLKGEYILMWVPISHLDYQDESDASPQRMRRAQDYASREEDFPPILVKFTKKRRRDGDRTMYVVNGNHRVLAAALRGDDWIRAFIRASDFDSWSRTNQHAVQTVMV